MLAEINTHLKNDVRTDVILEHAEDSGSGIFVAASRVPTPSETACVLKHIRCLVTVAGIVPIKSTPVTSTSFLKVIDVPMIPAEPKTWQSAQRSAFSNALAISPVGKDLSAVLKHAVRFMRTSAHSDTCVAWVDIHNSVVGTSARSFINKMIVIGGRNCQVRGAAPRPGSTLCTRCMRWGHHSSVCRSKVRRRLNYWHTAKMAQATDLPIELIDLIFSFLPPNHAEQVQWRRAAAAIGREPKPEGWNLSDHRCRRCGRVCLAMWDYEEQKAWVIQRWGYWGPRQWAIAGFFVLCPCDAMIGNYFGRR
ncbi:hypothetical protein AGABI1DRAFT_96181, partial [Agaricus bisporus var. burnettii JB137-S8]